MSLEALIAPRLFNGETFLDHHALLIERETIAAVVPRSDVPSHAAVTTLPSGLVAPGFIDAQVNGGGGRLFNETPDVDTLGAIAAAHRKHGSTALLPTYITDKPEGMKLAIEAAKAAITEGVPGIAGIHLEGPYLSVARKGAHDPALIRPLTEEDVDLILGCGIETILLTVAPENAPNRLIRRLAEGGVIVSLGHTDADYDTAMAAADAGATGITHLFNAMSPLQNREPGVTGAALDHGGLWAGIIADGHHVHRGTLSLALRAKRAPGRLFLVSDAMPTAGDPKDVFYLNGRKVTRRNGALTLDNGTLAGSDLTMDHAVRYSVDHLGIDLGEVLRMASLYPAQFLKLDRHRGRLAPGFRADLVHLDEALATRGLWIAGSKLVG
ncbi:N-acetylglucosamine-6-phosphate deacetylase [Labrys miyagiensis]|uniref:N-acetylglucosamine-6-phosphate deacetylase n=2 Tax=Labrys miyagiensis TaxID=346912 RepID=A0ABQ6CWW0_9HYPH|nr:N-acetylglucosamine-6-phosphate deacetylase [Labrys miyagiensis]GLS22767.1 N-acetylglucosamine-6-phosphate deacetylase [Labrys miyagiensis]